MFSYNQIADNLTDLREDWREQIRYGDELVSALRSAEEALTYAASHLNNPTVNGNRVLQIRLQSIRNILLTVS